MPGYMRLRARTFPLLIRIVQVASKLNLNIITKKVYTIVAHIISKVWLAVVAGPRRITPFCQSINDNQMIAMQMFAD